MRYRLKSWGELAKTWPEGKAGSLECQGPTYTRTMDNFAGLVFEHDFKKGNYNLETGHAVAWWHCEELN